MRGYVDDRDGYDDYYEGEEEEYEEEDEGEEYGEEAPKPTKEELEYLEMRKMLKESIRKQMKKENSSSASRSDLTDRRKTKLPNDNYGSFFGPSQPVIAQRVIQESKSLLENQHLANRIRDPPQIKKNPNKVSNGGPKSSSHNVPPKVNEVKVKAQKLKDTRDYSFLLSDDAELPAPSKAPPPRKLSIQNSEGRPAQVSVRNRPLLSNGGKRVHASHEERKQGSLAGHLPPKSGSSYKLNSTNKPSTASADHRKQSGSSYKINSTSKPSTASADHRKHSGSSYKINSTSKPSTASADSRKPFGNNSGNGPSRPVGSKGFPPRTSVSSTGNKSSTPGIKNPVNGGQKSVPSNGHSSNSKHSVVQRKEIREPNKPKMIPKQPVASSKPQINKPPKQDSMQTSQDHHPKNKKRRCSDAEDEMDVSSMIRSMFNYNPRKFVDDDDDYNMEAGFDEILKEEKRSAQIARKEDEEQLRLIEEEEERQRRRREAKLKKRRVGE